MRTAVANIIELLIGAILIGIGLLYLTSQYRALTRLTNTISQESIKDNKVFAQYNVVSIESFNDKEVYAAIMGYREYSIMVDENLIPADGHDYELYLTYVKLGKYRKDYRYSIDRHIIMIVYSFLDT
jgi:hypothetical protein